VAESRRFLAALACAATLLAGPAFAGNGDLGRTDPDVLTDKVLPALGSLRARAMREPVSGFNQSDAEKLMANRLTRFLSSVRSIDWAYDIVAELHRSRLVPGEMRGFGVDRYYRHLHDTDYASSSVRYVTLSDDLTADLATLPDTCAAICAVRETDRQRGIASASMPHLGPVVRDDVEARYAENSELMDWFANALRYRYQSYAYAIDHLLVETPDPAARGVDLQLSALERQVKLAERGRFCQAEAAAPHVGNPHPGPVIPSRVLSDGNAKPGLAATDPTADANTASLGGSGG